MKKIKFVFFTFMFVVILGLAACNGSQESSSLTPSQSTESNVPSSVVPSSSEEVGDLMITYVVNGGSLSSRVLTGLKAGSDVSAKLGSPKKTGYTFVGWYTDEALNNKFDGIMTAENLILYAKYEARDLSINVYNNSPQVADEVTTSKYGQPLVLTEPTRENATFAGWFYEETYVTPFDETLAVSADMPVYARWMFNAGSTIYVSQDGKANNAGTESSPLDIYSAMYFAGPNVKVVLKTGTYKLERRIVLSVGSSGSYNKMVTVEGNNALLDFTGMAVEGSSRGMQINGNYYHVKDLTIRGAGDNGMLVAGSNNIVENCIFYENKDSGLQISRYDDLTQVELPTWPANNLILNCTSFNNCDESGENADGFAAKLTCGNNIFDGCIAYCNSDDGYDLYAKPDSGQIGSTILRNCLAFANGRLTDSSVTVAGDGNGFKLGGSNISGHVIMENCAAWGNLMHGFTDNTNPGTIMLKNCTSFDNGVATGNKDNFNIARNAAKANNCFYGLLSLMSTKSDVNGDDVRGSIDKSIIRISLTTDQSSNPGTKYYEYKTPYEVNSFYETACGNSRADLTTSIFASVAMPDVTSDIHSTLRNADGSVNLGDFLKVVDADLLTYCDGAQIGANLSLTTNALYADYNYYYNEKSVVTDENDFAETTVKQAYDYLFAGYYEKAVFKNFKLPYCGYLTDITWKSSDAAIDVSGALYKNTAVITRGNEDKTVVLTATISYTDEAGKVTSVEKEFTYIVKAVSPNIGSITGVVDQVIYDTDNIVDEGEIIVVKDLNDVSGRTLVYGVDYTVETSYYTQGGNKLDEITNSGTYVAKMVVSLIGYDVKSEVKFNITYLSSAKNSEFVSFNGDYIIDGKVEVAGTVDCAESTVYIVALPAGASKPSPADLKGQNISGQYAAKKVVLDSADFEFVLEVGASVEKCQLFAMVVRNDWEESGKAYTNISVPASSRAENLEVASMLSIGTVEEFHKMATEQDANPKAYALTCDLDFTGFNWTVANQSSYYFAGYLEGNNHKITNLNIEATELPGIFTNIKGGIVKNLIIENSSVKQTSTPGTRGCGMIAGFANGCTIENVHLVNVTSQGYEGIGGIIGTVNSGRNVVTNCSIVNDSTHQISFQYRYAGGIIGGILNDDGASQNIITNVLVVTDIYSSAGTIAGGVIGRYKNDKRDTVVEITNALYNGKLTAAKYCGGAIGTIDKALTVAYLTNVVVYVEEFGIAHGESRALLGGTNSDDFTIASNTISIGSYDRGKDNCENNFLVGAISANSDWWYTIAGFDREVWKVEKDILLPSIR